ncbi:hypothetical protein SAMN05443572_103510 [Myxococcus fulvus]|uniref:Lipoprotein n=1 Tax=Myxococcus fulvus TaxID=33 RepID=A0A511TEF9_MYXFU|nr:hypothetical protein [Myxococcus fulvus]GEN12556.1 hypothetical protein MFU01_75930 [Myxococcus fulvus]SET85350.1 hypothetical protein SAMN05443572_103510 [Myxococcus fulvus]
MLHPFRGLAVLSVLVALGPPGSASARPMYWPNDHVALDDGTVLYGSSSTLDQIYAEINYEKYNNCTGVCTSGMESGDTAAHVFVDEGADPQASNTTEPGGIQVNPSGVDPAGQPFSKVFHKDDGFGNSLFGAGYMLDGALNAIPSTPSTGASMSTTAEGKVWAQVFGLGRKEVMRARATASGLQSGVHDASANIYILGAQIYEKRLAPGAVTLSDEKIFTREFLKAEKPFPIMFITVTVTATLAGNAGITAAATVGPTAAKLLATPKGSIFVTASAVASVAVASLGVEGSLTLVEVSLPISEQLVSKGCSTLGWDLRSSFVVTRLSGKLKAFVKINLILIKKKFSVTIASWSGSVQGSSSAWLLYNNAGTAPLYFTCVGGSPVGGIVNLDPAPSPTPGGGGTTPPPRGGEDCFAATPSKGMDMMPPTPGPCT